MPTIRYGGWGATIEYSARENAEFRALLDHYGGYDGLLAAERRLRIRLRKEKAALEIEQRRQREADDADRSQGWYVKQDLSPVATVVQAGDEIISVSEITGLNIRDIENQRFTIRTVNGSFVAEGFHAIEAVMALKPSALEGRRLKWRKGAWRVHNWIGHPVMDLLAMLGFTGAAIRFHDWTTPKPTGFR